MIKNLYNNELFLKYKNNKTKENILNLINYICENIQNIDLNNNDNIDLCEFTTKYLFNEKMGNWSETDTKFIIYYLVKKISKYFKIEDIVNINFLTQEEHNKRYGENSLAACANNNSKFELYYSPKVQKYLMSDNKEILLTGLKILFHEITHVMQNFIIRNDNKEYEYTKKIYTITLETIVRKVDKKFYDTNYINLFKENQAEKIGLQIALMIIKKYNVKLYNLYDIEKLKNKISEYEKRLDLTYDMKIYNLSTNRVMEVMEYICSLEIQKNLKYLEKYPILKLIYKEDGTKKDIIELYKERIRLIGKGATQSKVDNLYECIMNNKLFIGDSCKKETEQLIDYIIQKGCKDKFLINLLLYRLKRGNISNEKINKIFELLGVNIEQEEKENIK